MSNHMIDKVRLSLVNNIQEMDLPIGTYIGTSKLATAAIAALKETGPNSFISEIINRYAGLHPMDEHGKKLWNNLIDAVLTMKEKT
jgi:hypothetical protein